MSVYDTVGEEGIQIKCSDLEGVHYKLYDKIILEDGLYIGYEGYFIVKNKVIIFIGHDHVYTKWGDIINRDEILDSYNPITETVDQITRKYEDMKKTALLCTDQGENL